jgi:hypothetical protein
MISHNPDINCTSARLYYYDFLSKETREGIPHGALQHIKKCRKCQTEAARLKDLLVQADEIFETEQNHKDSAISTLLRLHFEYIGEPVKCDTVKPFLASLADPVLQIRIPTPITTHINKCKACRDDMQTLLDLHLPHKYLCRLGQILAEKPVVDEFSCSQAQAAIPAVVSMTFHETEAEILKHLCTCSNCRKQLYLHRESIRKKLLLNGAFQNGFPCDSVSAADIYDYCLPYGIDPADDEYIEFRESLTSHLRRCPKCLAKIQQLHSTISNIAERAESEVVTIYDIDESVKTKSCSESKPSADFTARLKEKVTALNMKPLLKAGLAAAAVIVIGFALLFNAPSAGAVTIEQICQAIKNAKNVYIAYFVPDKAEPIQEQWISRSSNIYMTKTGEESVLLDLTNKVRRVTGSVGTSMLPTEMVTETENMMAGFLGLVPIGDLSLIPENADWSLVASAGHEVNAEEAEVYDLTWMTKAHDGSTRFRKWRAFVDSETNLPLKTEFYRKLEGYTEYTLQSVIKVKYLSDDEIRSEVKKLFP